MSITPGALVHTQHADDSRIQGRNGRYNDWLSVIADDNPGFARHDLRLFIQKLWTHWTADNSYFIFTESNVSI